MVSTDRIDGLSASVALKAPVRVATTAAITLSGTQTIDGIALAVGDRVLVKNQTDNKTNGIYEVNAATWLRTKDFDGARDAVQGTLVIVYGGTANGGKVFKLTTANPVIFASSAITFSEVNTFADFNDVLVLSAGSITPRTLANRFAEYANVLDFGALPYTNGSASAGNSTAAFALAFATGKPVYVPAALGLNTVYDVGDLLIPDGGVMFAESSTSYSTTIRSNVILRKPAAGCTVILDTSGTSNYHLSGFCVDGVNRSCHGIVCITSDSNRGILRDITIRYCDTALGGTGAAYARVLDHNNCVITENVTGIRATIDSYHQGFTLAGNIGDGIYQPAGANDNTYIPYKVEFNRGHGFNFFSCSHQVIVGGIIDRNFQLGLRCGGTANRISVVGGVYRRNGRNNVFGENAHFGFDGSNVNNVNINGIVTATGADDDGGGATTPSALVSWISGNPTNIEITGNFVGVVNSVNSGTPTTGPYRLYDTSGTYPEVVQGHAINRNGGSQFIASSSQGSIATAANYTATLADEVALGTFNVRRRNVLITGRRQSSTQRWYANCTILSARESGNASLVDFRIDSQGGSTTTQFATTPNRLAYDGQTGNFTVGQVVTGGTSGATATIDADADSGTTGILTISSVTGVFQDNEAITDPLGGAAVVNGLAYLASGTMLYATVNSDATSYTITGVNQTGNTMHYGNVLV